MPTPEHKLPAAWTRNSKPPFSFHNFGVGLTNIIQKMHVVVLISTLDAFQEFTSSLIKLRKRKLKGFRFDHLEIWKQKLKLSRIMDTHEIGGSGRDHQSRTHTRKTDFSIESLLKKDPEPKLTENNKLFVEPREEGDLPMPFSEKTRREYESDQNSSSSASPEPIHPIMVGNDNHRFLGLTEEDLTTFSWLSCTRFKPPKLPRKFTAFST